MLHMQNWIDTLSKRFRYVCHDYSSINLRMQVEFRIALYVHVHLLRFRQLQEDINPQKLGTHTNVNITY